VAVLGQAPLGSQPAAGQPLRFFRLRPEVPEPVFVTQMSHPRRLEVATHARSALRRQTTAGVPQTSQSAVSRVSQPADRPFTGRVQLLNGLPIGKSAIPQVGKPAVRRTAGRARLQLGGASRFAGQSTVSPTFESAKRGKRNWRWNYSGDRRAGKPAIRQTRMSALRLADRRLRHQDDTSPTSVCNMIPLQSWIQGLGNQPVYCLNPQLSAWKEMTAGVPHADGQGGGVAPPGGGCLRALPPGRDGAARHPYHRNRFIPRQSGGRKPFL
jgi:hypothetical protein